IVAALRCCLYLVAIKSAILNHISNRFSIGHFSHSRCAFTATSIAFFTSSGVAQHCQVQFDETIDERSRVGLSQRDACYFAIRNTIDIVARTVNGKRLRTAPMRSLLTFGYSPTTSDGKSGPTSSDGDGDRISSMFGSPFSSRTQLPKLREASVIELVESVKLPSVELLIIPTDSHVHCCKQQYFNAKCVGVHTASFLSLNCILGSGVLVRLSLAEPIAELLSSSGFVGGVGILIAARVAAIACSIADFPPDSGVLVCDIVGTFGALCSLQSVFFSVVEVDIVTLASLLIGEGGGIPDAVICGDAAVI
ncbi:hypothetical protein ALC56_06472, partial [Trachymyrmex septentrionalis]